MVAEHPDVTEVVDVDPTDRPQDSDRIQRETADRSRSDRMIDEWGQQSFPASDPPPTW